MDGIRGEVSNKIRSAIKAKLMELGAYVDDELPDYIMVMVANKRSRQQMEEDLQLFLGDSTSTFTNWLHTVLSKLQQVTVNSTEIKKAIDKKRPSSEDNKKEKRKKLKKEKDKDKSDKDEKTSEKVKTTEKELDDNTSGLKQRPPKERPIKSEPVDLVAKDLSNDQVQINVQPPKSNTITTQEKKSSESKGNEEEDDEDFINIKADVEVDMWGDTEESSGSALKTSNIERKLPAPSSTEVRVPEPGIQEDQTDHAKAAVDKTALNSSVPLKEVVPPKSSSPSKTDTQEPKPAPRIIKISETIRQEQETLKPASKVVRDPQKKDERSPPSPIIFSTNLSEKTEDELEVFGKHIAHELRHLTLKQRKSAKQKILQVIYEHQDLDTQKNQISSHQYALPHSQSQTADQAFNKSPTKSKKMRDRSRDKRRRKKKSLELAAERVRQPVEIKLDRISTSGGKSVQNRSSKKRRSRSPVRFSALRMDSPSLIRPNTSYSLGISNTITNTGESPMLPRTLGSVVMTPMVASTSRNKKQRKM